MNLDRYPKDLDGRISSLCTAIIHEAIELQLLTNWKWWKTPRNLDIHKAKEELIDIWHFVIQTSIELKLSPQEIFEEYKKKHNIDVKRQLDGY